MVKIVDTKTKAWKQIEKLGGELKKGPVVGVGYPANKVANAVVAYAAYNHFGTSRGIPPRPFIAVTIDRNKEKIFNLKKKLGAEILSGQLDPKKALELLGAVVTGMVKETISGPFFKGTVPNAPATIRAKTVNGKVGDQPLIDTGVMRGATTWEVFPNGKPND